MCAAVRQLEASGAPQGVREALKGVVEHCRQATSTAEPLQGVVLKGVEARRAWEDWLRQILILSPVLAYHRREHSSLLPAQLLVQPTAQNNASTNAVGLVWPAVLPSLCAPVSAIDREQQTQQAHQIIAEELGRMSPMCLNSHGAGKLRATLQCAVLRRLGHDDDEQLSWAKLKVCLPKPVRLKNVVCVGGIAFCVNPEQHCVA